MAWPNDPIIIMTPGAPVPSGLVNELQFATNSGKHGDIVRIVPAVPFWTISGTWVQDSGGSIYSAAPGAKMAIPLPLHEGDRVIAVTLLGSIGDITSHFDATLTRSRISDTTSDSNGTYWTTQFISGASSGSTAGVVTVPVFAGSLLVVTGERFQVEVENTSAGVKRRVIDRIFLTVRRDQ